MAEALLHLMPSIGLSMMITGMLRLAFSLMTSSLRSKTEVAMRIYPQ
jgi:hypothetical protein